MPPKHLVEIERKFDVEDGTAVPPLENLPGVAQVSDAAQHRLEAAYFDTEDLHLTSRGITLRRRTGGNDAGWHLKLAATGGERHEYHEPLGKADAGVPKSLLRLVRVHVRDRELSVVARLKTTRTALNLLGEDESILAEFSDDVVRAEAFLPTQSTQQWREWELELVNGSPELLDAGEELLAGAGVLPARRGSKSARALGAQPQERKQPQLEPSGPAGAIALAYLARQTEALIEQDPRVRLDGDDAVHRMRVATRRMRSVLATYRRLFEDRETVNALRRDLKWLAGLLGEARDAEVLRQRLDEMIAQEPSELVMGPVLRRIDLELGGDYKKARTKVVRALDGKRYLRLLEALEAFESDAGLSTLGGQPAAKVIPKLVNRDVKRLRKAVQKAQEHPAGTGDHPALHEARKDAKRLRFAAEAASPVRPKKASRLAEAAHEFQKVLGDHQDSLVTRAMLRRLGAEAFTQGENGFTYGRLHAREEARALEAERRFSATWKNFPSVSLGK